MSLEKLRYDEETVTCNRCCDGLLLFRKVELDLNSSLVGDRYVLVEGCNLCGCTNGY